MRSLTLTRVKISIPGSNTALIGVASIVSFKVVRESISALRTGVVAELQSKLGGASSPAQRSEVVIVQRSGRREDRGRSDTDSWVVGLT